MVVRREAAAVVEKLEKAKFITTLRSPLRTLMHDLNEIIRLIKELKAVVAEMESKKIEH